MAYECNAARAIKFRRVPEAVPWRMSAHDYLESLRCELADNIALEEIPDVSWDPQLSNRMREHGLATYEELLLPALLADLQRGTDPSTSLRQRPD